MKILYVSVHQTLEYDEVRMFQRAGHIVFPLGVYFGFKSSQPFRPELRFGDEERRMMEVFNASGCYYSYATPPQDQVLSAQFVDQFDAIIVMHSIDFIERHWDVIGHRPVIWRTIGVNIDAEEHRIAPLRARGCKIVRYSPMEARADAYAGHDAIIRFAKSPDDYAPWTGEVNQIVTFSHGMTTRFPAESRQALEAMDGFPHMVGGDHNGNIAHSIGIVSAEKQIELLRTSRIYLYGVGTFITYTLNFIEAWMAGIPVVVLDGRSVLPPEVFKFAEVIPLINGGTNGMIVTSVQQARDVMAVLMDKQDVAKAIGTNGRAAAIATFGVEQISRQWDEFLTQL